jgi:DNA-binding MarR family transcriptional regulator
VVPSVVEDPWEMPEALLHLTMANRVPCGDERRNARGALAVGGTAPAWSAGGRRPTDLRRRRCEGRLIRRGSRQWDERGWPHKFRDGRTRFEGVQRNGRLTAGCQSDGLDVVGSAETGDVWTKFAMSIFELNGLLIQAGEGISQPLGQSSARWQVLGRVFEPQTVAQVARSAGRARQSVQRMADVLAQEGLITFIEHPSDRRTKLMQLTAEGADVLTAIYLRQQQWSSQILAQLDPVRLAALADEVQRVSRTVQQDLMTERESEL